MNTNVKDVSEIIEYIKEILHTTNIKTIMGDLIDIILINRNQMDINTFQV